jgi:hypothetical protein
MSEPTNLITKIGLNKLFLWMEAERLETFPEAFMKLADGRTYVKDDLINLYDLVYRENDKSSHPVRSDFLRNFYGLEMISPIKVGIRGVNVLEEIKTGVYRPTQAVIEIGRAYRQGNQSLWMTALAQLIAKYEVRTRLMMYLLGKGGGRLAFPNDEFFGPRSGGAQVFLADGTRIALFADQARGFNELLQNNQWQALGPFWTEEIKNKGYEIVHDFSFEGLRDPLPSANKLNSRLKCSLFLFKYLDILINQGGEWVVNPSQATTILGEEIAHDFVTVEFDHSPLQRLQTWQDELKDAFGFVIITDLVKRWAEYKLLPIPQAETDFDVWMRLQIYHGRVHIQETHAGQPRLGRGLFGDETVRKIRFEVLES